MAKTIDAFPEGAGRNGRPSRYPWDAWLDGQIWHLESEDFTGKAESFRATVSGAAKKRDGRARVAIVNKTDLVIQFIKNPEPPSS